MKKCPFCDKWFEADLTPPLPKDQNGMHVDFLHLMHHVHMYHADGVKRKTWTCSCGEEFWPNAWEGVVNFWNHLESLTISQIETHKIMELSRRAFA